MDKKKKINQYDIEIKKLSDLPEDDFLTSANEIEVDIMDNTENKQVLS